MENAGEVRPPGPQLKRKKNYFGQRLLGCTNLKKWWKKKSVKKNIFCFYSFPLVYPVLPAFACLTYWILICGFVFFLCGKRQRWYDVLQLSSYCTVRGELRGQGEGQGSLPFALAYSTPISIAQISCPHILVLHNIFYYVITTRNVKLETTNKSSI